VAFRFNALFFVETAHVFQKPPECVFRKTHCWNSNSQLIETFMH